MSEAANPLTSITESQSMCGPIVLRTAFSSARMDVISRAYEQVATMLPDAPATAIEVTFTDDIINVGPTLNVSHKDHIIAYAVSEDEISSEKLVRVISDLRARGFTAIYPDKRRDGLCYPSVLKIYDAIYCKGRKIKYSHNRLGTDTKDFPRGWESCAQEIISLGEHLQSNGFNSAPTDGFIAVRCQRGFLITASDTPKDRITLSRIAFVSNYEPASNRVSWYGPNPPSSETGCAGMIFDMFPSLDVVLHFHCKLVTYSAAMEAYRTASYMPYGTSEEALALIDKFRVSHGLVILRGHGEVVAGIGAAEAISIANQARNYSRFK